MLLIKQSLACTSPSAGRLVDVCICDSRVPVHAFNRAGHSTLRVNGGGAEVGRMTESTHTHTHVGREARAPSQRRSNDQRATAEAAVKQTKPTETPHRPTTQTHFCVSVQHFASIIADVPGGPNTTHTHIHTHTYTHTHTQTHTYTHTHAHKHAHTRCCTQK